MLGRSRYAHDPFKHTTASSNHNRIDSNRAFTPYDAPSTSTASSRGKSKKEYEDLPVTGVGGDDDEEYGIAVGEQD